MNNHPIFFFLDSITDVDECLTEPCVNDGMCLNILGSYVCQCKEGFSGPRCEQGEEKDIFLSVTISGSCNMTSASGR